MVLRSTLPRESQLFTTEREGMGVASPQGRQRGIQAREDDPQGRPEGSAGLEGPHGWGPVLGRLHYRLRDLGLPAYDPRNVRVVLVQIQLA